MFTAIISAPPGLRESMSCMTFGGLIGFFDLRFLIYDLRLDSYRDDDLRFINSFLNFKFSVYAVKTMLGIILFFEFNPNSMF
jgi:hypothetical protein